MVVWGKRLKDVFLISKRHKLEIVSAAPVAYMRHYTQTHILFLYDNEIKEQSCEWRSRHTISQLLRQIHFLAAGMWSSWGPYITASATSHRSYIADLWIRCVQLYTPSGTKPIWFCLGLLTVHAGLRKVEYDELWQWFFIYLGLVILELA